MADENTETVDQPVDTTDTQPEDTLGDPGKKALDAERKARRDAEKAAKAAAEREQQLQAELEKFRQDAMSEQEKALEQARKEAAEAARNEILTDLRQERLTTRVEAAATGKFADPKDAAAFLDLSSLDPDDPDAISAEIDRVLEAKPYLKASATQAPGDIDQGPRGDGQPLQLTRDDLKTMTPDEIVQAKAEGRLNHLLGL